MRRVVFVAAIVGAWWWWHRTPATTSSTVRQAAVLADGFAVRDGERVYELERDGTRRATHGVRADRPLRVFGTTAGAAAGWVRNGQFQLIDLKTGELAGAWGTAARHLCQGIATNDQRFAVGWMEDDGQLWWLHGPTGSSTVSVLPPVANHIASADEPGFCAIASAEDRVAVLWRDRNWLRINWCSSRSCSPLPASTKLDPKISIIAEGCLRNACLLETRHDGTDELMYVTESGAVKWREQPIVPDTSPGDVTIVGIADSAFAIALPSTVLRVDRTGTFTTLWSGNDAATPAIAWSRGKLLVSHSHGETVLEVPR